MPREVMGMSRGVAITGSRRSSLRRLAVVRADGGGANLPAAFVESLAAMSATNLPGPEGHQKLGPLAARSPVLRAEPATAGGAKGGRRGPVRSGAPLARLRGGGAPSDEAGGTRVERCHRHRA